MNYERFHWVTNLFDSVFNGTGLAGADFESDAYDTQGCEALLFMFNQLDGATDAGAELKFQETDDDPTGVPVWTDVAAEDLIGDDLPDPVTDTSGSASVAYVGNRRYVQLAFVDGGGAEMTAYLVAQRDHKREKPASTPTV
jgi:hypothetical protein